MLRARAGFGISSSVGERWLRLADVSCRAPEVHAAQIKHWIRRHFVQAIGARVTRRSSFAAFGPNDHAASEGVEVAVVWTARRTQR